MERKAWGGSSATAWVSDRRPGHARRRCGRLRREGTRAWRGFSYGDGVSLRVVGGEHRGEQGVGGFDESGHLLGFLVRLHVLRGVVGQIRKARGIPGVEEHAPGPLQRILVKGGRQVQDFHRVIHVFLGHAMGHGGTVTKLTRSCQSRRDMRVLARPGDLWVKRNGLYEMLAC